MLRRWFFLVAAALALASGGCGGRMMAVPSPVKAGYNPAELIDPAGEAIAEHNLDMRDFYELAERIRHERRPAVVPPPKNVLVLSGGGVYGSYCAGVLVGWTKAGTRPSFDVVTGISTGALIAPLAFLGSEYDDELQQVYTTLKNNDVFRLKKTLRSLLSESLADSSPLANKIEEMVTPELLAAVAAEHARGRRLYVGTTDLESRRAVIWDLGEIASRGTADDLALFRKVLLASAAIPGFFPPVRIPVTVDGKRLEERHVDGGVSNSLFFRPPVPPPDVDCRCAKSVKAALYGTNVYTLVAGKMYADASEVSRRALTIAANSISTLIYSQTRGDLLKLYTACVLTGMNYNVASIPAEFPSPTSSTDFDPKEMARLFDEGVRQATAGTAFRTTPPGLERGEGAFLRVGTDLVRRDLGGPTPVGPQQRPLPLFPRFGNGMRMPYPPQPVEK
jgi:predicted acylesterase/phospholipase RssA